MSDLSRLSPLPLVSIVIPAYNHACYLAEAVNSVLAQDYPHLELIVIDDGSTDDTPKVLAALGTEFHWESQKNIGQSETLARGWEMAQGDILGYLSADDVLEPGAVSASVAALLLMPEVVATYCDFKLIDPLSRIIRKVQTPEYSYERMLLDVSCPVGPGAFFRRSAYLQSGPWNPAYRQMPDYDFWLRIGLHGSFVRLPQVLAGFRVHEASQTYSVTTPERATEPVSIVTAVLSKLIAEGSHGDIKMRALASANLVSAQLHLRAGRFGSTTKYIRQAISYSPRTVFVPRTLRLLLNALLNRAGHRLLWSVRAILKAKVK